MYLSKVYKEVNNAMVPLKRRGSSKSHNLEGPRKMSTVEKADFSTWERSVHRLHIDQGTQLGSKWILENSLLKQEACKQ